MNKNKTVFGIILFLVTPIIINYGLLSWRAPGVNGEVGDWLGFFANFLGVIGAVLIAIYQFIKQRESEQKQDIENNRSYVDIQDFSATLMLIGVNTHVNSRVIKTDGYDELLKSFPPKHYGRIRVGYLKIAHYGIPELIFDCRISLDLSYDRNGIQVKETLDVNIGVIEKGVEIFIPLTLKKMDEGKEIELDTVVLNYSTLKGERLQVYRDYISKKEILYSLIDDSKKQVIFEYDMKQIGWSYPNKIDQSKLAP
ncbi:hypothetical protein D3C74_183240 [compost metagenome]